MKMQTVSIEVKLKFEFPDWVKWTAVDKDRFMYGYECKPHRTEIQWDKLTGQIFHVTSNVICDNWEDSLVEINPQIAEEKI